MGQRDRRGHREDTEGTLWKMGHRGECGDVGDTRVTQGDVGHTDLVVAVDGDGRWLDQAHPESLVGLEGETLLGLVRDLGMGTRGHRDMGMAVSQAGRQPPNPQPGLVTSHVPMLSLSMTWIHACSCPHP